ncbi:MAG: hypothetical protein P4L84_01625 [Isosphaeraceae bacterium]|nr:hypothetical protein [Isosphaeraceae bacterium]
MRKLFMSIIGISAILTLALGVAFAWSTTGVGTYSVGTGQLSVALVNPANAGNLLYPTNTPIVVATGNIQNNTPANPGIAVAGNGGFIDGITDAAYCGITDGGLTTGGGWIQPAGYQNGTWSASLTMNPFAPNDCQNIAIGYTVHVNVVTP